MRILNTKIKSDYAEWLNIWTNWKGKEIYAHPDYLNLYKNYSDSLCAIYSEGQKMILFPFSLRKISHSMSHDTYYDIITPYGYGDIYLIGKGDFHSLKVEFQKQFSHWAKSKKVVSEFIRFDLFSRSIEDYGGEVAQNNDNIVCDLTQGETIIWENFKPKVRRNIRKALSYQLSVETDFKGDRLGSFLALYYQTMKRRNASEKYFLEKEFFESIHEKLQGQFVYFFVTHKGLDIAAELVLISDDKIYFFLGGSGKEALHKRPNELLKYEVIKWGISQKKTSYVLGGGYISNDSLFAFKRDFAPNGYKPYFVGMKIYDQDTYKKLVDNYISKNGDQEMDKLKADHFFPRYRSGENKYLM